MKEKIKELILNEYKNLGLGEKTIDGAVSFIEPSVTKEMTDDDLVKIVKGLSGLMKSFQSEADVIRSAKAAAEKKAIELEEKLKTKPTPIESPKSIELTMLANSFEQLKAELAKEFETKYGGVQTELEAIKTKAANEKRDAFIKSEAARIGVPDTLMSNFAFGADVDEAGITAKLTEVKQILVNNTIQATAAPILSKAEVSADEVSEIMKHIR